MSSHTTKKECISPFKLDDQKILSLPAHILAASCAYTTKTEVSSFGSSGRIRSAKRDLQHNQLVSFNIKPMIHGRDDMLTQLLKNESIRVIFYLKRVI